MEEEKRPVGRPRKFKSAEAMQGVINDYFTECDTNNKPYTMTGLAIALGFDSRQSLINYESRDEFLDTIKSARLKVEKSVEELMLKSSGVVAGIIFNAKNNFGWRDKQEIEMDDKRDDETLPVLRKIADSLEVKGANDNQADPGAKTTG